MFATLKSGFIRNPTLEMDVQAPTDEIVLFGKSYRMYHDDWKHHVHLKCTNRCDADCAFCIEKPSKHDAEDPDKFMTSARLLIRSMQLQNHFRTLSVTGGEPTLFPKLQAVIDLANVVKPTLFSINSNGARMNSDDVIREGSFHGWFDLSKHAIDDRAIMRRDHNVYPKDILKFKSRQPDAKVRIQCVLGMDNGLKRLDDVSDFIWHFRDVADNFSFRSLIIDGKDGEVPDLFWQLRNRLFEDKCCVEQTIQDYYVYEVYERNGVNITVSWANMYMLRRYNETHEDNFLEEIIVHPDGMITGSWNKKALIIFKPNETSYKKDVKQTRREEKLKTLNVTPRSAETEDDGCGVSTKPKCPTCPWYGKGCRYGRGPGIPESAYSCGSSC